MAWYTTGTIAVSGTTVTGTGTNWLDNKQSIGAGQALLIPGSGTVKMYEIASVTSATKLTLKTSPGTIAAGQAYAILSFYTDSVPDFARRLAAQLSYYQSQMDGWQQIMTGSGNVTLTAPDGTSVTISTFLKLSADVASAFTVKGLIPTGTDLNTLGAPTSLGIYHQTNNTNATLALNYPENRAGTLFVTPGPYQGCQQMYITFEGTIYTRGLSGNWNAASPAWKDWMPAGWKATSSYATDLNSLTIPNVYSCNASTSNTPSGITSGGLCITYNHAAAGNLVQEYITMTTTAAQANRRFFRMWNGSAWSSWEESATVSKSLQLAGGTMTGAIVMGGSAGINMSGSNISNINVQSWVSANAAKASAAAMGFTAASGNRVQIPVAGGFFIIQMYTTVITANSNGDATISYPLAFTALGAVMACSGDFDAFTGSVSTRRVETTSFDVRCRKMDGSAQTGATRINWIATGFLSA